MGQNTTKLRISLMSYKSKKKPFGSRGRNVIGWRVVIPIPGFFHSIASFRKRTNMIVQLRDNLGGWVTTQDGIFALVESYFPHFLWLTCVGVWNSP